MNVVTSFKVGREETMLRSVLSAVSVDAVEPDESPAEDVVRPAVWNITGFGAKARVGTAFGDLPIEALRVRDEVRTASGSIVRVQWIDKLHIDADFINRHLDAQPIRIPANSFGPGRPMTDMIVAPRQDLCAEAHVASRFRPALDFRSRFGAHRAHVDGITYYRFHCGDPTSVRVEGVWVRV